MTLAELVKELAHTRAKLARLDAVISAAREEWERRFREEHNDILNERARMRIVVDELERVVRERAVEVAKETGDKTPAPGVKIRVVQRLKYDPKEALSWALSRGMREVLTLDKRAFEKAAKALKPEVIEIEEELQATIARDLEKALAEVGA